MRSGESHIFEPIGVQGLPHIIISICIHGGADLRTIIFDTETTGLKPGNICQLAYIIEDGRSLTGTNHFFKVDYIEPGAENVHGFSVDRLAGLSGGQEFSEHAGRIYEDFGSCYLWIAHNFSFDNLFLTAEFRRCGMFLKAEKQFCTMRYYTPIVKLPPNRARSASQYKYPNLSELMAYFNVTEDEAMIFSRDIFSIDEKDIDRHDARFDCAATYMCYVKGSAAGYNIPD